MVQHCGVLVPLFKNSNPKHKTEFARVLCPFLLAIVFLLLLSSISANAQTLPPTTGDDLMGVQPYQSYHGGDIDQISLNSGTLTLEFPFLSYPQRGKLDLSFHLLYNNRPQHVSQTCVPPPLPPSCPWYWDGLISGSGGIPEERGDVYVGWANQLALTQKTETVVINPGEQSQNTIYYYNYYLQFPDGSTHVLGNQGTVSWHITGSGPFAQYETQSGPFETLDGTGWRVNGALGYNHSLAAIIGPDGVSHPFSGTVAQQDPNGNQITSTSTTITDTLGRPVPLPPSSTSSGNTSTSPCPVVGGITASYAVAWTPPSYGGGTATYTFCYASVGFNKSTFADNAGPYTATVLIAIVLPNGQSWQFQYNDPDGTNYDNQSVNLGTLSQITLPTGGTISYTYLYFGAATGNSPVSCQNGGRWVASRTTSASDGTGAHTWTYAYTYNSGILSTTVTDPLNNDVVHTFGYPGGAVCQQYETQTQYYQGSHTSGTLLKTVNTVYGVASTKSRNVCCDVNGNPTGVINPVPTSITTTWGNGQSSQVQKSYDPGFSYLDYTGQSKNIQGNPNTATYGRRTSESVYDYPSGTSLLRTTNTSYAWQSPNPNYSSYLTNNLLNLPYSFKIQDGGGTQRSYTYYGYDETALQTSNVSQNKITGESYPGNQTSTYRWLNSGTFTCPGGGSGGSGGNIISSTIYFDTGMVSSASDPCSHTTSYLYSGTYAGALPTTVTNALTQSMVNAYDLNTGAHTSISDLNQLTTTYSYDNLSRLQQTIHPDSSQDTDTITRQEATFPVTATLTSMINTGQNTVPLSVFDGLGRISQTQHTSDPQGIVYVDKTYDGLGHLATVSNPYRKGTDATSSPGTTNYTYDALGRKTLEQFPDGSATTTAYCGPWTLVTDPTGRWRRSRVDALGRMVEVDEPNAIGTTVASTGCPGNNDPVWVTSYTFDVLGNLTQIVQSGSHTRTFTYDSLSRMLTSNNPEVGTITYAYNPDGTLLTKKDARAITTSYAYDALHRTTGVSYSNGDPSLAFTYDGSNCLGLTACQNIGHRTGMTDGAGSESWAYQVDATNNRNIHREQRTTNSSPSNITKTTTYYLDFQGNVTQIVYPTGRTVNYTYDSANRPSNAADASNGITYAADWKSPPANTNCTASAVCYTPQGSIYGISLGQSSSFTGFNISETFTSRLQPNELKASSSAGTAIDITYNFVDPVSNGNAGVVYGITNNLSSARSQSFTYDQLNRIISAGTSATTGNYCWGYQYSYDTWGNLLSQAGWSPTYNSCSETTMGAVTADGNNHLSGFSYDASGNTLGDGVYSYTWNGESQMKTAGGVTYGYDGDGRRAAKVGSKLYWYGSGGEILSETDASGNTLNEYVYFGGKRVAVVPASGSILYYAEDMLGSSRVIVQSNGTLCYDADFPPFGGERAYTSACAQNYKFEGKERDTETQNDDFGAREYSWRFGRWLSADWSATPVPVPYANLSNPQTLNLYAMVADDPESFADLDGHLFCGPSCLGLAGPAVPPDTGADEGVAGWDSQEQMLIASRGYSMNQIQLILAGVYQAPAIPPAQNHGEGSQANLGRRAAIGATAERHDGDTSMPYTPGHPTCNLFVQKDIAEAGAPKPVLTKADGTVGAPGAAEWAGSSIPGWRILGSGEKPQPGDVAARKENFSDATGHSGIVTSVSKGGLVTVMAAHATKIGVDMSFQPGSKQYSNHYQRYTGD